MQRLTTSEPAGGAGSAPPPSRNNEQFGKILEYAICLLYGISYVGSFKYTTEEAEKLSVRLENLRALFPGPITHTAKGGCRYDFTATGTENRHLSVKSNTTGDKICPQVIGQPSKPRFIEHFKMPKDSTNEDIKKYIIDNICKLLNEYEEYTFDCPILYHCKKDGKILFIQKEGNIDWNKQELHFSHIKNAKEWKESTCVYVDGVGIGEFQVHNHRSCIKFRWNLYRVLERFSDVFTVHEIGV